MMFNLHKCRCDKIQEVKVYNSKEVEKLYQKVLVASAESDVVSKMNFASRRIIKHSDQFQMKMIKNNFSLYLVTVIIRHRSYRFVVDTGAQISAILSKHKNLIETYQSDQVISVKSAGGGMRCLKTICLDQMFFGALEIKNQPFVIMDENDFKIRFLNRELMSFDGILGWDILSQIDFELDTKAMLFSMVKNEEHFTYCNLVNAIFPVIIVYDEKKQPAIFGIDTGAKISWINDHYAIQRNLKIVCETKGLNIGVHGLEKLDITLIKECIICFFESKITLRNLRSGLTQVFTNLQIDGILGNEVFKKKKVQFLNSKGIIRIME